MTSSTARHDTVLLQESVDALAIAPTDTVVDATLGGAGHFTLMLEKLGKGGVLVGIDADSEAIARAQVVVDGSQGKSPNRASCTRQLWKFCEHHGTDGRE